MAERILKSRFYACNDNSYKWEYYFDGNYPNFYQWTLNHSGVERTICRFRVKQTTKT